MILLETGLKSYLPFFPGSSRRSKMEHSDASPSLTAGIFGYFTSLTKIFSNYRFYGLSYVKVLMRCCQKLVSENIYHFLAGGLRGSHTEHSVASPGLMAGIFEFYKFDEDFLELRIS